MNHTPLTGVYAITLTAPNGRERKMLAYLPTEEIKRNYMEAVRRRGLRADVRSKM